LYGCAFGVIDRTSEQQELTKRCFQIKKPAFLYEARCADIEAGGFGAEKLCTSIQGFNPKPYVRRDSSEYIYDYPKSWPEYLSDRKVWDKKLFSPLLFTEQRSIIAPIEVGEQLRITGVYEYPRGETGHVLITTAVILSGAHNGTSVELPPADGFNDQGPNWTVQWFYKPEEGVQLTKEYLEPCAKVSPIKTSNPTP